MAQRKVTNCDVCGVERGLANHWYMLDTTSKTAVIAKFSEETAGDAEFHLCGVGCLQVKISRMLDEWGGVACPQIIEEVACSTK